MKQETKSWLLTFLAGFLATVLGIVLTFGIESRINAHKRAKTAHLLALQIVDKMAETLERVDESVAESFLINSLSEYVQTEVDDGMDACKEILHVEK